MNKEFIPPKPKGGIIESGPLLDKVTFRVFWNVGRIIGPLFITCGIIIYLLHVV